jgi:hypothetical protein
VSFVTVVVVAAEVPLEFFAVAVTVIWPSAHTWPLMPVKWTTPAPLVPDAVAWTSLTPSPSPTTSVIVSVGSDVDGSVTSKLSDVALPESMYVLPAPPPLTKLTAVGALGALPGVVVVVPVVVVAPVVVPETVTAGIEPPVRRSNVDVIRKSGAPARVAALVASRTTMVTDFTSPPEEHDGPLPLGVEPSEHAQLTYVSSR